MPFCGNEQDRAQPRQGRIGRGHHEKKKPSSGKGASRFRLKGPYYYATSIGPQILRCPWQGYTGKFFAPGLGVGSLLNLGTAGTSEKRFSGQDPEFFSRILRIMTLAQHRAEAVISSACFPFCGLGVLKL
jgi:hypothetical protein